MSEERAYLTIHGHFYQPPRENPWLEAIEMQESAFPFHDWNERICAECYNPNSVAKIVDGDNKVINIINNYSLMSFNFGPTLLSWLENYAPKTYERIIKADVESVCDFNGHGNALAQVYNHIIMPLASKRDKYTQTIWGIEDFKNRYGRMPEGIWLAEAAVDDETLEVLADCGIKFTVLSPYQADKVRALNKPNAEWHDVGWGNIDPAKPYRYFIKSNPEKYVDLFFYDGSISKSVAFDNLLTDGNRFVSRLEEGISNQRNYPQLVNIATDGESYGHHTKFGDMALAYVLGVKAKEAGFKITNYGQFLAEHEVVDEVDIKPVSSWSCSHGVGRWCEDCGCSTGGHPGWNQKWRKPLREALNYLRDEFAELFENEGAKYFKDTTDARNRYITVILDRSERNLRRYFSKVLKENLDGFAEVKALKLLEIQRQSMLMFTSCGWFFSEISGIEAVQIMKYAARAIQLAQNFGLTDLEENFLKILEKAESNIPKMGNGRNVYEKFVRPSVVNVKQIASLWAYVSLFNDFEYESSLYCYKIKKLNYQKTFKGNYTLVTGRIEVQSRITLEKNDMMFALLQYPDGDFHCTLKEFSDVTEYAQISKKFVTTFMTQSLTELIREFDEFFGKEYYTLRDIFLEERTKILDIILKSKMDKFEFTFEELFKEVKGSVDFIKVLNIELPKEFRIAAEYTLSKQLRELILENESDLTESVLQGAINILYEAKYLGIELDKSELNKFYGNKLSKRLYRLANNLEIHQVEDTLELLKIIEKLELNVDMTESQNIYFSKIYAQVDEFINQTNSRNNIIEARKFLSDILEIGQKLNINVDYYRNLITFAAKKGN